MLTEILSGNAAADGGEYRGWFLGDFESWHRREGLDFDPARFGLRHTRDLEIKWGSHPKGQERPDGWTSPTRQVAITILIQGDFTIRFRDPEDLDRMIECRLRREGDYVIWREDVQHTWRAQEDSVVITVRWIPA